MKVYGFTISKRPDGYIEIEQEHDTVVFHPSIIDAVCNELVELKKQIEQKKEDCK